MKSPVCDQLHFPHAPGSLQIATGGERDVLLRVTIVVCGALLGLLLALIVVASNQASVLTGLSYVLADPWGVVTLLDLGVGLLFVAAWLAVMEPNPWRASAWIISLCVLGNVTTLVYLLWRTRSAESFRELFLPR